MARHRSLSKNLQDSQPTSSHLVADPAAKSKKPRKKNPGISIFLMFPLLFKILVFLGIFVYGLFQLYTGCCTSNTLNLIGFTSLKAKFYKNDLYDKVGPCGPVLLKEP
jgi:hypothetical protein